VVDLLKTAKHGGGENIYLVRFHYVPPSASLPIASAGGRTAQRGAAVGCDPRLRSGSRR
jgi:hypothetical protein